MQETSDNSCDHYELIVIGAGPAGLAAALEAWKRGLRRILLVERDGEPGGILNQCIHTGFGLQVFKEELTGPEYAQRFIDAVSQTGITLKLDTMVLQWENHPQGHKTVHLVNPNTGYQILSTDTIILAMGCRERARGAIALPGDRPSGIFTAGTAQRFLNREGLMVGSKVVILGSGDIGLIMARRMTLEGAKVLAVAEIMPHSKGLVRNIVQCLHDFNIPLYLSHTLVDVIGKTRLEKVILAEVDESLTPIPGTEKEFSCDTLLLSVGLIPENELSSKAGVKLDPKTSAPITDQNCQTSIPGVFACGNVRQVHDLVDSVTREAEIAGQSTAEYVQRQTEQKTGEKQSIGRFSKPIFQQLSILQVPYLMEDAGETPTFPGGFENHPVICVICPKGCSLLVDEMAGTVTGNGCKRGETYGLAEVRDPKRIITSTVRVRTDDKALHANGQMMLPVRSKESIPKRLLFDVMKKINQVEVELPVKMGQVIIPNVCGTGTDIVASRELSVESGVLRIF